MACRDQQAAIECALENRHEASVDLIALRFKRPSAAGLVVHMAERTAKILIAELDVGGEQPADVDGDVLVFRQTIEINSGAHADVEIETPRQVEDEGLLLAHLKRGPFPPGFRRTEEIV